MIQPCLLRTTPAAETGITPPPPHHLRAASTYFDFLPLIHSPSIHFLILPTAPQGSISGGRVVYQVPCSLKRIYPPRSQTSPTFTHHPLTAATMQANPQASQGQLNLNALVRAQHIQALPNIAPQQKAQWISHSEYTTRACTDKPLLILHSCQLPVHNPKPGPGITRIQCSSQAVAAGNTAIPPG